MLGSSAILPRSQAGVFYFCAEIQQFMSNQNSSLVILAAGMGSRYGGLKQLDSFGPQGETIIDYSIYDAIQAGFKKIVFIIRESFKKDIQERMHHHWGQSADLHFVCQELHMLPLGFDCPKDRMKPWGTGHALWVAKNEINEAFGVINADDYYGREAMISLNHFLRKEENTDTTYAVIAYLLQNTLSEHGAVNRGICFSNTDGTLKSIEECKGLLRNDQGTIILENQSSRTFENDTPVSMNMWAFGKTYFDFAEKAFIQFLKEHREVSGAEFYIPELIQNLIDTNQVKVKLIKSPSSWFGVTYQEDRPIVQNALQQLIDSGFYPNRLYPEENI